MDNMGDIITVMYTIATTMDEEDPRRAKLLDSAADLEVIRRTISSSMDVIESFIITVGIMVFDMSIEEIEKANDPMAAVIEKAAGSSKMKIH